MNKIFDYEFEDVTPVQFYRYGSLISRDEVVALLNSLTVALRQIEYLNGEVMADNVTAYKTYRIAYAALNKAKITEVPQ